MVKKCSQCGNVLSDTAKFCGKCGTEIKAVESGDKSKIEQVTEMASSGVMQAGSVLAEGVEKSREKFNEIQNMSNEERKERAKQYANTAKEKGVEFVGDVKDFKNLSKKKKKKVIAILCGIIIVILFISKLFSGESYCDVETYKEKFFDNIGVAYKPEEWKKVPASDTQKYDCELYFDGSRLSIGVFINSDNEVIGVSVATDMRSFGDLDEEFLWKCASVSAITGYDMDEAAAIVREINKSGQMTEIRDGIIIDPYDNNQNLAFFTIKTEKYD